MAGCSRHSLYDSHYRKHQWGKISEAELPLPESKTCFNGSQIKGGMCLAHDSKLQHLSVYLQREKVKKHSHRTRNLFQKETRRELQSISKAIHILSGPRPLTSLSLKRFGGSMSSTTPQYSFCFSGEA